ncbi:MAG TPA: type II secretion system protein [Chthoniobacteraceae bacterium]|jgi:prepilin-type N-terminal cleavage/methylation domain-containing protein
MKTNKHPLAAFTLIELLVVISIIAILAGVAAPALSGALTGGKMAGAMAQARQIGFAPNMYASDSDGSYPSLVDPDGKKADTSNAVFRGLFPSYLSDERIFAVGGSKAGARVDNNTSSPAVTLARGENHWAYLAGLSSTSNASWPLVVDHTDGSGYYSDKENTFGGTWKGAKAIVIGTDNSARIVKLVGTGSKRFIPRPGDRNKNALATDYMGDDVTLLEPER